MTFKFTALSTIPSIAQLVERWTVVVLCQISIGRWFKSGSKDFLKKYFLSQIGQAYYVRNLLSYTNPSLVSNFHCELAHF